MNAGYGKDLAIDLGSVEDEHTRRNLESVRNFLRDHPMSNFFGKLVTITLGKNDAGSWTDQAHGLSFTPKDTLLLSVNTTQTDTELAADTVPALATVQFDARYNTKTTIRLNVSHACVLRVLVGTFIGG